MMRLAQVISVLGHPLFMPLYAFGLLIYANPYINMMVPEASKYFTLGIAVFTIILPILTAVVFKLFGLIDSLFIKLPKKKVAFSTNLFGIIWAFNYSPKYMCLKVFYYL